MWPQIRYALRNSTQFGTKSPTLHPSNLFEDETGSINLIVRAELAVRQRRELLQAQLLAAIGTWQNLQGTRHLLVGRLEDHSHLLATIGAEQAL